MGVENSHRRARVRLCYLPSPCQSAKNHFSVSPPVAGWISEGSTTTETGRAPGFCPIDDSAVRGTRRRSGWSRQPTAAATTEAPAVVRLPAVAARGFFSRWCVGAVAGGGRRFVPGRAKAKPIHYIGPPFSGSLNPNTAEMSTLIPASPATAQPHHAVTADELCEQIRSLHHADEALVCDFARIFFGRMPRTLLEERSPAELAAMTVGAWEFLERPRPDQVNVEVADPRDEGWKAPVSVIRTEVGDRPFIVDTIREYLNGENIPILQYVYPVLRVERGPDGAIPAGGAATQGDALVALGHVETPHLARRDRAEQIRAEVEHRLSDV